MPTRSHTVAAQGGIAAPLANSTEDNWHWHMYDTVKGSDYLGDQDAIEYMCRRANEVVVELEHMGMPFDRLENGKIYQRPFGGHTYPRLAHVGDRTGLEMIRTLQDHGIHRGIDVHMECTVLILLVDGGRVAGAFGYDRERGARSSPRSWESRGDGGEWR
jgi:succinate dehydrogenase / fumarate reductase flavoprotein subunit